MIKEWKIIEHKFLRLKKEIPQGVKELLDLRKSECIDVHDDSIVNNKLFLKGLKSFKVSFKNRSEEIDYHVSFNNSTYSVTFLKFKVTSLLFAFFS